MKAVILFAVLVLTGCATQYKPDGFSGGFSETWYEENLVQVTFRGNGSTSSQRASDFALLRAAELGKQKGFQYLVIGGADYSEKHTSYTTPGTATTNTYGSVNGTASTYGSYTSYNAYGSATSTTTYNPGQTYNVVKPQQSLLVGLFLEKPEINGYMPLRIDFVIKSIAEKYKIALDPKPQQ